MNKNVVRSGQSFLNKVVETTGNVDDAFEMAMLNGMSITDRLLVGQKVLNVAVSDDEVAQYFNEKQPATVVSNLQETDLVQILGIGTMGIGSTFIVEAP